MIITTIISIIFRFIGLVATISCLYVIILNLDISSPLGLVLSSYTTRAILFCRYFVHVFNFGMSMESYKVSSLLRKFPLICI